MTYLNMLSKEAAKIAIDRAVAAERERCAKIADQFARANENLNDGTDAPGAIAAARRNRLVNVVDHIERELRRIESGLS